tara:strand:+ start:446 stop:928 length:483 start_codon:yes stop_codon:yes gene_type:complete
MTQCLNIPNEISSIATWIQWHKALKKCVGKTKANELFMTLWDKNNLSSTIELRDYMASNGVNMDKSAIDRLTDTGAGVVNWVGGAFEIASFTSVAILVIIVGGAGMIIYNMAKSPEGSARLVAGIATRGKSEMIGGGMKSIGSSSPKSLSAPKIIDITPN